MPGPKKRQPIVPDPTPEEIAERSLEVQKTWTEETRLLRIVDSSLLPYAPKEWFPPTIKVAELPVDIYNVEPGEYPDEYDFSQTLGGEDGSFENYLNEQKEKK